MPALAQPTPKSKPNRKAYANIKMLKNNRFPYVLAKWNCVFGKRRDSYLCNAQLLHTVRFGLQGRALPSYNIAYLKRPIASPIAPVARSPSLIRSRSTPGRGWQARWLVRVALKKQWCYQGGRGLQRLWN